MPRRTRATHRPRPRPPRRARSPGCCRRPRAAARGGARGRPQRARTSSRADRDPSCRRRAQPDTGGEQDQHERGEDGGGACTRRRVSIESEQCNLSSDDDTDSDQQLVPASRNCENNRCTEDDHRERDGGPREPRVDRLQGRREAAPEQPDRGERLGRPCDRDHDSDRREAARERKREPVGHEVVVGRGRGKRCVSASDARAGGAERHLQLAVARPERRTQRRRPQPRRRRRRRRA